MILLTFDTPEETNKFISLYQTYWKTVYYTLTRLGLDEHTIEDLSQEVYIIISKHLDDIDLTDFKRTQNYIITITRNYCKNYLRDKNRKPEELVEEYTSLPTESDNVLDYIINKEQLYLLAEEIGKLEDIYKAVLELKYVNNLENEEIASILKVKKKTVEMRLYRAKQILKARIKEQIDA